MYTQPKWRGIAMTGALGALTAIIVIGALAYADYQRRPVQQGAFAVPYDQRILNDPLEILLVQDDGQAFATLARDPSLSRADVEFHTPGEGAYRAQRPLLAYLAWGLSLGRSGWVPPAQAVRSVIGTAAAAATAAALVANRGGPPLYGALVLLLPGLHVANSYMGPEPLAFALAAAGLLAWERDRVWPAAALFALAGLGRETMLIVPAVLLVLEVAARRRSRLAVLSTPFLAYGAWIAIVWLRIGSLPTDAGQGRLSLPMRGVIEGLRQPEVSGGFVYAVLFLGIVAVALVRAPRDHLAVVGLAYIAFGSVMGRLVWVSWEYFGRILLPGVTFALIALLGSMDLARRSATAGEPASSP